MTDYAIFRSGGKQYKVSPGNVIDIEKLTAEPGSAVELADVLVVFKDGALVVGQPTLVGARVIAQVQEQTKDRKITVFKYKSKVRYRRKKGHRQQYTRLSVKQLLLAGEDATLWQSADDTDSVTSNKGAELETDGENQTTADLPEQAVVAADLTNKGREQTTTKGSRKPRASKTLASDATSAPAKNIEEKPRKPRASKALASDATSAPAKNIEEKPRKPRARKALSGDASSPPNDIKGGKH